MDQQNTVQEQLTWSLWGSTQAATFFQLLPLFCLPYSVPSTNECLVRPLTLQTPPWNSMHEIPVAGSFNNMSSMPTRNECFCLPHASNRAKAVRYRSLLVVLLAKPLPSQHPLGTMAALWMTCKCRTDMDIVEICQTPANPTRTQVPRHRKRSHLNLIYNFHTYCIGIDYSLTPQIL